jgi:hypothetical protein
MREPEREKAMIYLDNSNTMFLRQSGHILYEIVPQGDLRGFDGTAIEYDLATVDEAPERALAAMAQYRDISNVMITPALSWISQEDAQLGYGWRPFNAWGEEDGLTHEELQEVFDSLIRCQAPRERIPAHLREDEEQPPQ